VQVKIHESGKIEGRLDEVTEKGIKLIRSEKRRIEGRKKKEVVDEEFHFNFDEIKETKIVVSFK
jgi:ribosome maturation factor RimP